MVEHAHSKKQWSEMLKESEDRGQHVFLFLYIHRSTECLIQKVHLLLAAQIYEQKSVQAKLPPAINTGTDAQPLRCACLRV